MNVVTAIGWSEKPTSTRMWIQHIHSANSLLDPLIMYKTQFENNPHGSKPLWWCMVQFRAANVDIRHARRVLGMPIEKSWFVLRWRTWWGVCSEYWELNNVENTHTHIYTRTLNDDVYQPLPAVPDAVRQKDLGHLHSNRENSSARRQRGTRLTNWLHFFYLSEKRWSERQTEKQRALKLKWA